MSITRVQDDYHYAHHGVKHKTDQELKGWAREAIEEKWRKRGKRVLAVHLLTFERGGRGSSGKNLIEGGARSAVDTCYGTCEVTLES